MRPTLFIPHVSLFTLLFTTSNLQLCPLDTSCSHLRAPRPSWLVTPRVAPVSPMPVEPLARAGVALAAVAGPNGPYLQRSLAVLSCFAGQS